METVTHLHEQSPSPVSGKTIDASDTPRLSRLAEGNVRRAAAAETAIRRIREREGGGRR